MKFFTKRVYFTNETNNWLLSKKSSIKSSTYYRYKYLINKYILTYFKGKSIYYFKNYDLNIYKECLSATLSAKTIRDILTILKSILKYIERKYKIDYKLEFISLPKINKREIEILKDTEIAKLEQYCLENNTLKNIGILICLNTGLRLGEICALKWNDIELEKELISVDETIQRLYVEKGTTEVQINAPKTKTSIRKIPIPSKLINQLKELRSSYSDTDYFLTGTDKCIEPRTYQNTLKKCLEICKINHYNFHILRHTFATNCIKVGMDAKSLSELLGHSNVNTTLNLYVHSSYETKKRFLDKL